MNKNKHKHNNVEQTLNKISSNRGRFFKLHLTRISGSWVEFVAKFRKLTDKSLIVYNTSTKKDVVIPLNTIGALVA